MLNNSKKTAGNRLQNKCDPMNKFNLACPKLVSQRRVHKIRQAKTVTRAPTRPYDGDCTVVESNNFMGKLIILIF